jgi:DNA-binding NarL/FixJ family response regulator
MIRVVLVDDHIIVRQGVRSLLEEQPDLQVIGDGEDAVQALHLVRWLRPDVLVADLMLPGLEGLELIQQVRQISPDTNVVVLSMHADVAYVAESLSRGALGYVAKQADIRELVAAVRAAAAGQPHLSPGIDYTSVSKYLQLSAAKPIDPLDTLSLRERQVLELVAQGRTNAEIAAQFNLSRRTIETHRAHMMKKLGLESPAEVFRFALRRGLLSVDS